MNRTAVGPMKWALATEGILEIPRIATGVGVILYSPGHHLAAGLHVLARRSPSRGDGAGSFLEATLTDVWREFGRRGVPLELSVALAGGGSLLAGTGLDEAGGKLVQQVRQALAARQLGVKLENVGGSRLRTLELDVAEGRIRVS